MTLITDKTTQGNALIKEFLYRWAPSIHRNYERYNMPFEFHNSIDRQLMVWQQLRIYLSKEHPLMQQFQDTYLIDEAKSFNILVEAVRAHSEGRNNAKVFDCFS